MVHKGSSNYVIVIKTFREKLRHTRGRAWKEACNKRLSSPDHGAEVWRELTSYWMFNILLWLKVLVFIGYNEGTYRASSHRRCD
jgi:hypothetical protein